jgi:hypothetical protein
MKRLLRAVLHAAALGFVAYLVLLIVARPWHRSWGATASERASALPGDEHAGNPARAGNRAVAIHAPSEVVWAWLVQIGQDRGGFYSYAGLENLFGLNIVNAERIVPQWQRLAAGDLVRAAPATWLGGIFGDRVGWTVDHVEQGHVLALRYWIFEVESTSASTSRLHARTHAGDVPVPIAPLMLLTFEPAHFVMERAMLLGIKQRAERVATNGHAT